MVCVMDITMNCYSAVVTVVECYLSVKQLVDTRSTCKAAPPTNQPIADRNFINCRLVSQSNWRHKVISQKDWMKFKAAQNFF